MKTSTLLKRIEKRVTLSKSSVAYRALLDLVNNTDNSGRLTGKVFRPTTSTYSGRHGSITCHKYEIRDALELVGLKFETGNDSPKGGVAGNYIKILTKIVNDNES